MKKIIFSILALCLLVLSASAVQVDDKDYYEVFKDQKITLNVYNWGEYISNGEEDSVDVIKEFENLTGINVNYTNYATNEDLFAKLSSGSTQYDIIIPSDYMIAKMIENDMLETLNYENIPNIKYIAPEYHKTSFDPEGKYCVPYTWGTVGIVYNKKFVTKPVDSWEILWDEDFKGKILMFDNSRDAFGIAEKLLGYSMNTTNPEELEKVKDKLLEQKPLVQNYVMDQIFDKMELEEAYVAPYYAGDCITMMENNENLAFCHPKEGTNIFIDSICIPKGSKNKKAAEAFINFLCETDIALANCEYICYSTPHTEALKLLDEEVANNTISYPSEEILANCESYVSLPSETNKIMDSYWTTILTQSDMSSNTSIIILTVIVVLGVIILITLNAFRKYKKKNNNY